MAPLCPLPTSRVDRGWLNALLQMLCIQRNNLRLYATHLRGARLTEVDSPVQIQCDHCPLPLAFPLPRGNAANYF